MALSRRELERLSHRSHDQLPPEAVGTILTLLYVAKMNRALPGRRELTALFSRQKSIPPRLRAISEMSNRHDGPVLTRYTEMVDSAQQAAVLRRFNPGHVNTAADLAPTDALHILEMARADFGDEISWLEDALSGEESSSAGKEQVSS